LFILIDSADNGGVFFPPCRLSSLWHAAEHVLRVVIWIRLPENSVPQITQVTVWIFMGSVAPRSFRICAMHFFLQRFEHSLLPGLLKKVLPHILQTTLTGRGFAFSVHFPVSLLR